MLIFVQIFLDVDCSSITYDTEPSATIMNAVEKAKKEMPVQGETAPLGRTESANETLANSLLTRIDPKNSTADEIKEAFCRDIDSFSFEMEVRGGLSDCCELCVAAGARGDRRETQSELPPSSPVCLCCRLRQPRLFRGVEAGHP